MTDLQNTLQKQMTMVRLYVDAKNKKDAQCTLNTLKATISQVKESKDIAENIHSVEKVIAFAQTQIDSL